ncbi:HNH endonuclease signature motif containing protein [Pseudoclavibacter sp. Z016]|uniref:HNH endonuclease signature motif containing protein n=1 Tax=Pseudoclavibacter sp. Z016 TaxID=2080581 RepID=UPI000CE7C315|nr:HNH endonuclease signature motif containing protein [Pseudoclavibacter sp. Z016]PPF78013.1 hypothetical protein C5B99_01510 [Pseudoclavibacter sp. Z016]
MIDEALATRIPEGWMPPAQMVERVRNLERFLLVSLIAEANADVARAQAEQARVYALAARTGVAEDERAGTLEQEWALRSWKAEIAAVTNTSRQAVASIMGRSAVLTEDFPLVHAALAAGEVSMAHARIVCEAGTIIVHEDPAEQAARRELLVQVALEKARSTSPGRLKDFAIKQAERLTASSLEERYDQAMGSRAVLVTREADGMASLGARHSLPVLTAIDGRLSEIAKSIIAARGGESDDPRTFYQVRADVFAELLLTGELTSCPAAAGITAKASVTMPVLTILDARAGDGSPLETTPALLDGVTPIPMSVAKALAANVPSFERILTHPITGTVVEVDRYRPTEEMRAWLRARDVHCRFPGCRLPAEKCDLDHTIPASEGGPTSLVNLAGLCRWNHTVKGNTAWRVRQLPGGVLEWTSPSGIVLVDAPEPRGVTFGPSPGGAPSIEIRGSTYRVQPPGSAPGPFSGPFSGPASGPVAGPDADSASGPSTGPASGPALGPSAGPATGPAPGPSAGPAPGPSAGPATGPASGLAPGPSACPATGPASGLAPGPSPGPASGVDPPPF